MLLFYWLIGCLVQPQCGIETKTQKKEQQDWTVRRFGVFNLQYIYLYNVND